MSKVKGLLASKPCEPLKSRALYVVFLVEKDVRVKGGCAGDCLNHEQINRQYEIRTRPYKKHRNEEEWRKVSFVAEVRPRDQMILGIVGVMEVYVITK